MGEFDWPKVGEFEVAIGVAYLADWYVRDDLAAGRLVRVLQDWTPSYRGLALYYPPGRQLPGGLRAFVDLIHELGSGR